MENPVGHTGFFVVMNDETARLTTRKNISVQEWAMEQTGHGTPKRRNPTQRMGNSRIREDQMPRRL